MERDQKKLVFDLQIVDDVAKTTVNALGPRVRWQSLSNMSSVNNFSKRLGRKNMFSSKPEQSIITRRIYK